MAYTRISDNLYDSSLWSDVSYEGLATLKVFLALLREARTQQGRVRRLTPAKAMRLGAVPPELAVVAVERLVSPDDDDSSGVAEGRRLILDPEGGPNDYIVTNWERYGREFERDSKTARQRRWRAKRREEQEEQRETVDATVYTPSTCRRDVDGGETQEEKLDKSEKKEKTSSSDKPKKRTRKAPQTCLSEDWQPRESTRTWARSKFPHVDFEAEVEGFKEWNIGKGTMWVDWDKALQSWIRRTAKSSSHDRIPVRRAATHSAPLVSELTPYLRGAK